MSSTARRGAAKTLFLASTNPGKLREFREAAEARGIALARIPGIERFPACVEDGETFEANARKKALHYAALARGLVFADDSGLSVDALGGAPGLYSARYAGPRATDEENNAKLLAELRPLSVAADLSSWGRRVSNNKDRRPRYNKPAATAAFPAHYTCVIALASPGQRIVTTEGRVDGLIVESPRGEGGFGYDPYFFYPPFQKTFAEISASEKFEVSHRGIAFRRLLDLLPDFTC